MIKEECLLLSPEGRDRRCRLLVVWQSVPENGGWNDGTGSHKGPDHMLFTYLLSILCIVFSSVFTCAWYLGPITLIGPP